MTYEMKIREAHEDGKEEGHAEERNEGIREGMLKAVAMLKKLKLSKEVAAKQIADTYSLTYEEAVAMVNSNW